MGPIAANMTIRGIMNFLNMTLEIVRTMPTFRVHMGSASIPRVRQTTFCPVQAYSMIFVLVRLYYFQLAPGVTNMPTPMEPAAANIRLNKMALPLINCRTRARTETHCLARLYSVTTSLTVMND